MTSTIAKSFGMNSPCSERKCVLRFRQRISELDDALKAQVTPRRERED